MFDNIIVPHELIPLREKASNGCYKSTYELAHALITQQTPIHHYNELFRLLAEVMAHEKFPQNFTEEWEGCLMLNRVLYRGYQEGEVTHERFLNHSINYCQKAIRAMTNRCYAEWDFTSLHKTIDALEDYLNQYRERYIHDEESTSDEP